MKNDITVCVRCGERNVDTSENCPECGEDSVLSLDEVVDLLNEIYLNTNNDESFREWIIRMNDGE